MRLWIALSIALLAGITASVFLLVHEKQQWFDPVLKDSAQFSYPDSVVTDVFGNTYLTDRGLSRILKLNSAGEIEQIYQGMRRNEPGGIYIAYLLRTDAQGNLYVYNAVSNIDDMYGEKSEILKFKPDLTFDRVIYSKPHGSKEERAAFGEAFNSAVYGMQIKDQSLFFFSPELSGELVFYEASLDGSKPLEKKGAFPMDLEKNLMEIKGTSVPFLRVLSSGALFAGSGNGDKMDSLIKFKDGLIHRPWWIEPFKENSFLFSDLIQRTLYRIDEKGRISVFASRETLKAQGYDSENFLVFGMSVNSRNEVAFYDFGSKKVLNLNAHGKILSAFEGGKLSFALKVKIGLFWFLALFTLAAVGFLIWILYVKFMKRRSFLMLRYSLMLIPLIGAAVAFTSYRIYQETVDKSWKQAEQSLTQLAYTGALQIPGEWIEGLRSPEDREKPVYEKTLTKIKALLNENQDSYNELLFNVLYRFDEQQNAYIVASNSSYYGVSYPFPFIGEKHAEVFATGKPNFTRYSDPNGEYLVGLAPVKNAKGEISGVYEIGFYTDFHEELEKIFMKNLFWGTLFSVLAFFIILGAVTYFLILSIRALRNAVNKVSKGELDVKIQIRSHDEVGDLGRGFNVMSVQLKKSIEEIVDLNKNLEKKVQERTCELNKAFADLEMRNKIILHDLSMASRIQQNLLPSCAPASETLRVHAVYLPMEQLGGDFYDFICRTHEKKLGIFVSDVSGHGVPAAFITTMIKTLINFSGPHSLSPSGFLEYLNRGILNQTNGNFLTAFYGIYHEETRTLSYAKGAHPEGVRIRKNGSLDFLSSSGKMLGVFPSVSFEEKSITLHPGDKVILYTDGLTEAADEQGVDFEEKMRSLLKTHYALGLQELITLLLEEMKAHQVSQEDDVCVVGLEAL